MLIKNCISSIACLQ